MKIKKITKYEVEFDDGSIIDYDHCQDCCEYNYADFTALEDTGIEDINFKLPLIFEETEDGFRFGNPNNMFFVPCYSIQNGYYAFDVDIYYKGDCVLTTLGEWIDG